MRLNPAMIMRLLVVLCLTAMPPLVSTAWADHHKEPRQSRGLQNLAPERLAPESKRAGISNKRAAALVKQRYSASRILGVSLLDDNGPPIYRVRTLSPQGVVRSVFVDGNTGEVFE